MVSVLDFNSDDPSLNPADDNNFSVKLYLKRMKLNKKRPGMAHLKNSSTQTQGVVVGIK